MRGNVGLDIISHNCDLTWMPLDTEVGVDFVSAGNEIGKRDKQNALLGSRQCDHLAERCQNDVVNEQRGFHVRIVN